ncbi:flagellar biosynthesis protein FlgM [Polaribacter reichenbachii]|uniref:Flagellar biosynthesis protein FlgM n=1 Tax=Polaribacter reichenbachii TaxID=996801 RepID=A0A1B8U4Z2_9FLAO|nr:neutral zinc metallopeptidase [Polaribacter reichenbachii]APZ47982.1 flagellar biosynthesis protein FlgM [Polaribacter reichenbachii]AUC18616.1 flagellar biosynthesis protein FlgM [Polaribacter reichenbachii]OBY66911.1 flagellar biosynthesis protein FlgM [Polaribacter reichenbachii]
MKWRSNKKSSNVEDRRGQSSSRGFSGGSGLGGMLIPLILKLITTKKGLIIVAVVGVLMYFSGVNPLQLLSGGSTNQIQNTNYKGTAKENELAEFSNRVLRSTEDVWNDIIRNYREPTLVLFSNSVTSACGSASSATGPFYCPGDEKLYIDLSFFQEMETRLNAPGDFAQAYVIAHEVGHHIQNLMGTTDKMQQLKSKVSQKDYNQFSVKLELQADFLAGVWAHHAKNMNLILDDGDLQEALDAAFAIGDDRLQKQSSGRVVPDSFTHGTSAQRMRWFKKGFVTGDVNQGDTFNATSL